MNWHFVPFFQRCGRKLLCRRDRFNGSQPADMLPAGGLFVLNIMLGHKVSEGDPILAREAERSVFVAIRVVNPIGPARPLIRFNECGCRHSRQWSRL